MACLLNLRVFFNLRTLGRKPNQRPEGSVLLPCFVQNEPLSAHKATLRPSVVLLD
jgi:hypothetical protein